MADNEPEDPPTLQISYSNFPRISGETFCKLFDDHSRFEGFTVIDCRTEREYNGGHIKGAIRCHPFESSIEELYHKIWKPRCCYVFHCEFSQFRAPTSFRMWEEAHKNSPNKPLKMHSFILDGGYSQFYPQFPQYCDGAYTSEMSGFYSWS